MSDPLTPSETLRLLFDEVVSLRDALCEVAIFEELPSFAVHSNSISVDTQPIVRVGGNRINLPEFDELVDFVDYVVGLRPIRMINKVDKVNRYLSIFRGLTVLEKMVHAVAAQIVAGAASLLTGGDDNDDGASFKLATFEEMPSLGYDSSRIWLARTPTVKVEGVPVDVPEFHGFAGFLNQIASENRQQINDRIGAINQYFSVFRGLTVLADMERSTAAQIISGAVSLLTTSDEDDDDDDDGTPSKLAVFEQMPSFDYDDSRIWLSVPVVVRVEDETINVPEFNKFGDFLNQMASRNRQQINKRITSINQYLAVFQGLTVPEKMAHSAAAQIVSGAVSLLTTCDENEKKEYQLKDSGNYTTPCQIELDDDIRAVKLNFNIPDNVSKYFTGLQNPRHFIRGQLYAAFQIQGAYTPQIELTYADMFLEVPNFATQLIISSLPLYLQVEVKRYV